MLLGLLCISILINPNKISVSYDEPYLYWLTVARTDIGKLYKMFYTQGSPCTNQNDYILSIYTFPNEQGFFVDIIDQYSGKRSSSEVSSWSGDVNLDSIKLFNTKFYFIETSKNNCFLVCTSLYLKEQWRYKLADNVIKTI